MDSAKTKLFCFVMFFLTFKILKAHIFNKFLEHSVFSKICLNHPVDSWSQSVLQWQVTYFSNLSRTRDMNRFQYFPIILYTLFKGKECNINLGKWFVSSIMKGDKAAHRYHYKNTTDKHVALILSLTNYPPLYFISYK